MQETGGRLPRFRQVQDGIGAMKLTPRDKKIISQVARFHFLRSTQIVRLIEGAPVQLLRRLQVLYHHRYLDRPRCQIDYFHRGGSRPMAYGLGSRGVALMRREYDVLFEQMVWGRGGADVGRVFLEHALLIAEAIIAVEVAARESNGIFAFMSSQKLPADSMPRKRREPMRWSTTLNNRCTSLIPDAVFALDFTAQNSTPQRVVVFLEADRGTMPVVRKRSPHLSNIARKLSAYVDIWKSGAFSKRFHTHRFLVLTVTESNERVKNITDTIATLTHGKGLFHTITTENLTTAPGEFLKHCERLPRDRTHGI